MKVPTLKQAKNTCGPTALKMVLEYYGYKISIKEIIKGVGGIKEYGVRSIKLAEYAKKLGFNIECLSYNKKLSKAQAKIKKPVISDILKHLKKKRPVILAVRSYILFNKPKSSKGHFIVVTKYQNDYFWYNDPKDCKQHKIKEEDLLFAWHSNVLNSSGYLLAIWPK